MEWISIKNKLPNKMEKVLCFYEFEPESPNVIGDNIYYGGGIWMCGTDNVTYWMPLPEEPSESVDKKDSE